MNTIASLNDKFRAILPPARVAMTPTVDAMRTAIKNAAIAKVREFEKFALDDDVHDFGVFDLEGFRFAFKIDYDAPGTKHISRSPVDIQNEPVVTISFADDC